MYLQAGPPGINRSFNIGWDNGNQDVVKRNPLYFDVQYKTVIIGGEIARAKSEKKPAEEIAALQKKLEEAFTAALESRKTFEGPFYIFDPKLDIADRPRIWLGQAEWEGPLVDWPPKGRNDLFFAGGKREDDAYLREIFTKLLPRAYRRPITLEELDRVVKWTLKTKAEGGLSLTAAVREGVKNVLCSPKFLYLGSEAMPARVAAKSTPGPQPVDGWQFASRLSYLLWSTAPDEELYRLASQEKLRNPAGEADDRRSQGLGVRAQFCGAMAQRA